MAITQKSMKVLWANAAGRCSYCREKLCLNEAGKTSVYTIGEMAHIKGDRPGSNRYDPEQSEAERDNYSNLILLCPTHHTLIDKPENEQCYSVDVLHDIKLKHEAFVNSSLDKLKLANKYDVAKALFPLMKENHEVFINFGPRSDIALKNPQSQAHVIWLSERLSTIIPNNRRMLSVIDANKQLFAPTEQEILAKFALHVRTYDQWVREEVSYEGVVGFPAEFEKLVEGLVHASV